VSKSGRAARTAKSCASSFVTKSECYIGLGGMTPRPTRDVRDCPQQHFEPIPGDLAKCAWKSMLMRGYASRRSLIIFGLCSRASPRICCNRSLRSCPRRSGRSRRNCRRNSPCCRRQVVRVARPSSESVARLRNAKYIRHVRAGNRSAAARSHAPRRKVVFRAVVDSHGSYRIHEFAAAVPGFWDNPRRTWSSAPSDLRFHDRGALVNIFPRRSVRCFPAWAACRLCSASARRHSGSTYFEF